MYSEDTELKFCENEGNWKQKLEYWLKKHFKLNFLMNRIATVILSFQKQLLIYCFKLLPTFCSVVFWVDYKIHFTACNSKQTTIIFLHVSTDSKPEVPSEILFSPGWDCSSCWEEQGLLNRSVNEGTKQELMETVRDPKELEILYALAWSNTDLLNKSMILLENFNLS